MSSMTRKLGLNLLQSPTVNTEDHSDLNNEMVDTNQVETFLDDNNDFLENYIQRKVPRSKLESWLFRPDRRESIVAVPPAGGTSYTSHIRRQRSRSFTPLRKLSASKFEESGLSTPILVTDVDGQPTFLRTSPKVSFSPLLKDKVANANRRQSVKPLDRNQSLFLIVEEFLREKDGTSVIKKVAEGLKTLLNADHVSLLLTDSVHAFFGDLHVLDENDDYKKKKSYSADRLMTGVITSKQTLNVPHPETIVGQEETLSRTSLIGPLIDAQTQKVRGVIRVAITQKSDIIKDGFTKEDENIFNVVLRFAAIGLTSALERKELNLELARSEVFLELAQTVFSEKSRIEPTIRIILSNFLTVIECERCQILLTDAEEPRIFKRVFGLQRSDLNEEGEVKDGVNFDGRFPINAAITGEVASTGKKINIEDLRIDERFDTSMNNDAGIEHVSMLCIPILDSPDHSRILGVISLINKHNEGVFTENDERFAEAFSLFCGMAIRNAAEFEKALMSEAKLQVAFDTINYQASSSEEESKQLTEQSVASASTLNVDRLDFSYLGLSDMETYKCTIRIFTDFGLLSHFNIKYSTFCRWVLTVKKNYRNDTVAYHNWYHAFNVTQMMFAIIKNAEWEQHFSKVECLAMLIACISHDLDHRGTTNAFQLKSNNPLATLYSSSTMERHHLNQCLLLLNIPGNRILENLTEEEYSETLSVIERCILATDLGLHFRHAADIHSMATSNKPIENFSEIDRFNLQSLMMTSCDLGAISKPWPIHDHVTKLVAEEFWIQGDIERETFQEEKVLPMLDRSASLAQVQIGFIENVAQSVFQDLSHLSSNLKGLLERALENKEKWKRMDRESGNNEVEDEDEDELERQSLPARNL